MLGGAWASLESDGAWASLELDGAWASPALVSEWAWAWACRLHGTSMAALTISVPSDEVKLSLSENKIPLTSRPHSFDRPQLKRGEQRGKRTTR